MAIDFTFPPEVEEARQRVRAFMDEEVRPTEQRLSEARAGRAEWRAELDRLRQEAQQAGLWMPHMPPDWGGMGLGPTALAAVSAEAATTRFGPYVLNCYAPDEGNMHTLLHFGTPEQKERYLRPMCEGRLRSCFAMTEPEVAGSDPTLIQTRAELRGDQWILNGHKWFISGARGAGFAIVIARTEPDPPVPQAATSALIVDIPSPGFEIVRDVVTMAGSHNHCELRFTDVAVPAGNLLGERGGGHRLGQARLGPARLAHCMRWLGQIQTALDLLVARARTRYAHGSLLAEKQGIQWLVSESAIELYQAKLMVLHAAYLIEHGRDYRTAVSMTKHHVANTLWRVVDRALQVHGALGYSTDSPLAEMLQQARWSRLADGADEVHKWRVATEVIETFATQGSTAPALGDLPV
ncbi:acyl-CoA dehydrogenase family protein [Aciditerrimonas ferrireducens]|jgi:acyl-CoA dehydrogenase|uniref:Acyl-CoA dehydrogenase family protein n=1 Tax=Aciditerrimonas ferrireducens TaxID=667306 RepID=A0ABV6C351_9ACTN